jgi:hypothetical protein
LTPDPGGGAIPTTRAALVAGTGDARFPDDRIFGTNVPPLFATEAAAAVADASAPHPPSPSESASSSRPNFAAKVDSCPEDDDATGGGGGGGGFGRSLALAFGRSLYEPPRECEGRSVRANVGVELKGVSWS